MRTLRSPRAWPVIASLAVALGLASAHGAHAGDDPIKVERNERCALRLSLSLLGKSPSAELLASRDPQGLAATMLTTTEFEDRFARFVNAEFNTQPGKTPADDAVYYVVKHVLVMQRPFEDVFLGRYRLAPQPQGDPRVEPDAYGLGYFRMDSWLRRYAGNEGQGYMISAAYRIMHNTVGLRLTASTNAPEADVSATGRKAPACAGCHYHGWSALDHAARVLPRRRGVGDAITFEPPSDGPQDVADAVVRSDEELVRTLVRSTQFDFNACRLTFKFVYGRAESSCESRVFDACMDAFAKERTIHAAALAIVSQPSFCE